MAQHNETGKYGEDLTVEYLQKKGYTILETNYRFQKAEIDIIAQKDNTLVVVEVKTRSSKDFGLPQEFVKPKQIKQLVKAIDNYIVENDLDYDLRFDIAAILIDQKTPTIDYIEDAFYIF